MMVKVVSKQMMRLKGIASSTTSAGSNDKLLMGGGENRSGGGGGRYLEKRKLAVRNNLL